MAKSLQDMTASELQKAHDRQSAIVSAHISEMIAAGRGQERPSETRTKTDDLSRRRNAESDKMEAIYQEMERRKRFHGSLHKTKSRWI